MAKKKKVGSTGRFGPRYGVRVRKTIKDVEESKKKEYECPRCHHEKVKRKSAGIWHCRKCDLTFAGGAYQPRIGRRVRMLEEGEE